MLLQAKITNKIIQENRFRVKRITGEKGYENRKRSSSVYPKIHRKV